MAQVSLPVKEYWGKKGVRYPSSGVECAPKRVGANLRMESTEWVLSLVYIPMDVASVPVL